jgi:DNA-binding NtrC family response regulator
VAPQRGLRLSPDALQTLEQHPFFGNVRELRNLLERCALLCDGKVIEAKHIHTALHSGQAISPRPHTQAAAPAPSHTPSDDELRQRLAQHQGSRAELAAQLGMSERTLYRKIKSLS